MQHPSLKPQSAFFEISSGGLSEDQGDSHGYSQVPKSVYVNEA